MLENAAVQYVVLHALQKFCFMKICVCATFCRRLIQQNEERERQELTPEQNVIIKPRENTPKLLHTVLQVRHSRALIIQEPVMLYRHCAVV